ncbi:hypothetical protein [Oceanicaulis alexandrii]|uniref:hypothetical protein n=1 Tax=Oceanicaulis alexandrii TaxID=153233 RepID=UPI0023522365|nr:hypothetical protein [Oceanicaulis alexandrii]
MSRSYSNQLAGQIGESLVVAELGRRGIIATAFAGNVPDIDILAYRDSSSIAIQVKTWRTGSVHFNASRYLVIEQEDNVQHVVGAQPDVDADRLYAFVKLGEHAGSDSIFMLSEEQLVRIIRANYEGFLAKHDGIRPKNPNTTHCAVHMIDLAPFKDNWRLIDEALTR